MIATALNKCADASYSFAMWLYTLADKRETKEHKSPGKCPTCHSTQWYNRKEDRCYNCARNIV